LRNSKEPGRQKSGKGNPAGKLLDIKSCKRGQQRGQQDRRLWGKDKQLLRREVLREKKKPRKKKKRKPYERETTDRTTSGCSKKSMWSAETGNYS